HLRVRSEQSDELLAICCSHRRPLQRTLSYEVWLGLANRPTESSIIRCYGAISLLTYDDVALLGAQHVHGLGTVGCDSMLLAGGVDCLPHCEAKVRWHIYLETELTSEAHPE